MAFTLEQNYETGRDYYPFVDATRARAQSFVDAGGFELTKVEVHLYLANSENTTGSVTCKIYTVDGSSRPDSLVDTADASIAVADVTPDAAGDWYTYEFSGGVTISAGTEYAIVLQNPGGDLVYWSGDDSSPSYDNGIMSYSLNGGATWSPYPDADLYFRAYSGSEGTYVELAGTIAATTSVSSSLLTSMATELSATISAQSSVSGGTLVVSNFPSGSTAATNSNLSVIAFGNNSLYYEDV